MNYRLRQKIFCSRRFTRSHFDSRRLVYGEVELFAATLLLPSNHSLLGGWEIFYDKPAGRWRGRRDIFQWATACNDRGGDGAYHSDRRSTRRQRGRDD